MIIERIRKSCVLTLVLFGTFVISSNVFLEGAEPASDPGPMLVDTFSSSVPLPDGIEVHSGKALMQVLALRDGVLRIRISQTGQLPEDASWAVLPSARKSQVSVTTENTADSVGFETKLLQVKIRRKDLKLIITDFDGNIVQEDAAGWPVEFRNGSFRVYKRMPADEHYFGLGDKTGPLDRRNEAFTMWNTDAYHFQESTDPLYKTIPFFLTERGGRSLGVLMDNTWRSSFDFGKRTDDVYSFGAEGGPLDYYVLYGPSPEQVLEAYVWLTGPAPLPPLWSLGFQQSRYSYGTEAELREVADRLRTDKIPCDALYLDIDYQQDNRPFTVDAKKFPHFAQMLSDLKKQDFHVVAITDLHIADIADGYPPYDSGLEGNDFVKNPDGSVFVGTVWPGPSVFPDFTARNARRWWGTLYTKFVADGVSGFWNDMDEPSIFDTPNKTMPDDVRHRIDEPGFEKRVATHLEIHNIYGMENSRATYEGLLKLEPNRRPFVLTRATYAGGQRYAATWTGDNTSTWNHLRLTTPMLLNLGLSGFAMSGADVGGFAGSPSTDLLTKWIELGTFQPIDRDHTEKGTNPQEPWVGGLTQENIRRRYIDVRYHLMPYLYTTAEAMSRTGLPIVRPLFLEFPHAAPDGHPLDLDAPNEFLFGPDLLVAPAPYPEEPQDYTLILPPGDWFNYWTGERANHSSPVVIHPQLETLPVYVHEGSIVPMQPLTQSTSELPQGPLTLRVYPGAHCHGSLYQDDGISLAYKHGDFLRMRFSCTETANSVKVRLGSHEGGYPAWWKELHVEIYGWDFSSTRLTLDGKADAETAIFDPKQHMVSFTVPDDGKGSDLEITPQR